jgi:hypothetical protein
MSDILSQLKSVYDSRKKRQSLLEAEIYRCTAEANMYKALKDEDRVRTREYQMERDQWTIEVIRCNDKAWKDADHVERAQAQIRILEAVIKKHEAWRREDKDAVRRSTVEHYRCIADNDRLFGGINLDAYERWAHAYETGEAEPTDPIMQAQADKTYYVTSIRSCENVSEQCRVQASQYVPVIREICENAKLLAAIFQAFQGKFESD